MQLLIHDGIDLIHGSKRGPMWAYCISYTPGWFIHGDHGEYLIKEKDLSKLEISILQNMKYQRKLYFPTYLGHFRLLHPENTHKLCIWVRSRNCGCLVTWFCYQLITKPGNKTATVPWPDPYDKNKSIKLYLPLPLPCTFIQLWLDHPLLIQLTSISNVWHEPWVAIRLHRADSGFAPSQWETSLQSNAVSHWLGAKLQLALLQSQV